MAKKPELHLELQMEMGMEWNGNGCECKWSREGRPDWRCKAKQTKGWVKEDVITQKPTSCRKSSFVRQVANSN